MITIRSTETFNHWLAKLRDRRARAKIAIRVRRAGLGHFGDCAPVGAGVSEMRIDYGPGYRVYFLRQGPELVVLLCGGDKDTQRRDIAAAKRLAANLE